MFWIGLKVVLRISLFSTFKYIIALCGEFVDFCRLYWERERLELFDSGCLITWFLETLPTLSTMESLAQLEALCERLYNSQDSAERAHAENTLKCFSMNADYIAQCQYILDNALTPYALMLASSSLLKQVTEQRLPLQLRLDIRNILVCFQITCL